jgi:hypothetical protein
LGPIRSSLSRNKRRDAIGPDPRRVSGSRSNGNARLDKCLEKNARKTAPLHPRVCGIVSSPFAARNLCLPWVVSVPREESNSYGRAVSELGEIYSIVYLVVAYVSRGGLHMNHANGNAAILEIAAGMSAA